MTGVKLTSARLDVLEAVGAGEVKHHTRVKRSESYDELKRDGEPGRKVTGIVAWLHDQGLITLGSQEGPSFFALRTWLPTGDGEFYLHSYDS